MSDTEKVLLPCPFCGEAMMFRKSLWPSDGNVDAIIDHAAPTECGLQYFTTETTDESVIAAWNTRTQPASTGLVSKEAVEALEPFAREADRYDYHAENRDRAYIDESDFLTVGHLRRARTVYQALRSEAGDERAAIVAWLRLMAQKQADCMDSLKESANPFDRNMHAAASDAKRLFTDMSYAIERGDHISPPSLTREDEHG